MSRVLNFGAGPSALPLSCLKEAQASLLDYKGSGMSVMELSHRSSAYSEIHSGFNSSLRTLLSVPKEYDILLMQGGATLQFSAVIYNLVDFDDIDSKVLYGITGVWSEKAAEEARKLLGDSRIDILFDSSKTKYDGVPESSDWNWPKKAPKFLYYCDNETVHGVEFPGFILQNQTNLPEYMFEGNRPLIVCDMSSNFASRRFNVSDYDVIIAGAQKNIGPAGLTVVIIKSSILNNRKLSQHIPLMMDYKILRDSDSLYNTPPCFAIYMSRLVLDWALKDIGGIEGLEKRNLEKASKLYEYLTASPDLYLLPVKEGFRSRMNIPFRLLEHGAPSEVLEKNFIKFAESRGLVQLAGHRSVGGLRTSLYNAMDIEGVSRLIQTMEEFRTIN